MIRKDMVMTDQELHFLGIKVVYKELVDQGYEVLNVRKEADINPQILAKKEDQFHMIVVKTARFPHMGVLLPNVAGSVLELARKHKAIPHFASVGIANAHGENDEEMGLPERDGEYYINFKGLQPFPKE